VNRINYKPATAWYIIPPKMLYAVVLYDLCFYWPLGHCPHHCWYCVLCCMIYIYRTLRQVPRGVNRKNVAPFDTILPQLTSKMFWEKLTFLKLVWNDWIRMAIYSIRYLVYSQLKICPKMSFLLFLFREIYLSLNREISN